MSSELKPLLALLFTLSYFYTFAQEQSFAATEQLLLQELESAKTKEDSVDAYNELSFNYRRTSPEKMMQYANAAIRIGQTIGYTKGLARACKNKGSAYHKLKINQDSSFFYYNQAIAYAERVNDHYTIAACTNNIGILQVDKLELNQALRSFFHTIKLIDSLNIEEAYFMKASALSNVGDCLMNKGEYEEAIEHIEQAIKIGERNNLPLIASVCSDELAMCYLKVGRDKEAHVLMKEVGKIQEKLKDHESRIETLLRFSEAALDKEQAKQALKYAEQAFELSNEHEIETMRGRALLTIAKSHLFLGNLDEAEEYAKSAYENLRSKQATLGELRTFELLNEIYLAKGDYGAAYGYLESIKNLQQKISNERATMIAKEAIAAYDNDRRIKSLEAERNSQNTQIKYLVIFLLIITLLFFGVFFLYRKSNKLAYELDQKNKETIAQSEELKQLGELKDRLFSTISHDLRSPIANFEQALRYLLSGEINQKDFIIFAKDLKKDATQLRQSVEELMNWSYMQMVGLQPKRTTVNLCRIIEQILKGNQKAAQNKNITFLNKIATNLCVEVDQEHLNSIVRNLTTNAIKFSQINSDVIFRAYQEKDQIIVSIEDQGIGIESERLESIFHAGSTTWGTAGEKGTGLGLALCKEFVEQNGGEIWVSSKMGKGSTFYVSLPVGNCFTKTYPSARSSAVL